MCLYVIIAGPISGFGMNPARSFASAFPAHTYTAFWIYMIIPFAGMLSAAEFFLFVKKEENKMPIEKTISDKNNQNIMHEIIYKSIVCISFLLMSITSGAQVTRVDAPGITVKDMNTSSKILQRSIGF